MVVQDLILEVLHQVILAHLLEVIFLRTDLFFAQVGIDCGLGKGNDLTLVVASYPTMELPGEVLIKVVGLIKQFILF
jgi:hypothetical protein